MLKCVKVTLAGVGDRVDEFYKLLKKGVNVDGIEGAAIPTEDGEVVIIVNGRKKLVDEFVDVVDEVVVKHNIKKKDKIGFFMEPFFKDEDYRGMFRFIKK